MSYNHKYYLNYRVRKAGYILTGNRENKTINVKSELADEAHNNKHVKELSVKYRYNVQFINPMLEL